MVTKSPLIAGPVSEFMGNSCSQLLAVFLKIGSITSKLTPDSSSNCWDIDTQAWEKLLAKTAAVCIFNRFWLSHVVIFPSDPPNFECNSNNTFPILLSSYSKKTGVSAQLLLIDLLNEI